MHITILQTLMIAAAVAIMLMLVWVVAYNTLLTRLQRMHPVYYRRLGRPYTWFIAQDFSRRNGGLRIKRARAWWRSLRILYKRMPPTVYRDATSRRLARAYKLTMRAFLWYGLLLISVILPAGTAAYIAGYGHHETKQVQSNAARPRTMKVGPDSVDASQASKAQSVANSGRAGVSATENPSVRTSEVSKPGFQFTEASPLSRTDLNRVLASVGLPGQKRTQKLDVCNQVIGQSAVASDVQPASGGPICTDANLSTYSAY